MRDYCDAQPGFWLNSKFWSKFSRIPLSGIEDQNTPPLSENFRFGMTKVYSGIPPPPFWKTSDLGWPKFTPEYPPPFWKTSDLGWPKFTLFYPPPPHFGKLQIWDGQSLLRNTPHPPNENCQRVQVRNFQNTESYYMWRLYPTRITTSCVISPFVRLSVCPSVRDRPLLTDCPCTISAVDFFAHISVTSCLAVWLVG